MKLTPKEKERIRNELYSSKSSVKDIMNRYHISRSTVYYILNPDTIKNWRKKKIQINKKTILLPNERVVCGYCDYVWKPIVNHIPVACPKCNRTLFKYRIIGDEPAFV